MWKKTSFFLSYAVSCCAEHKVLYKTMGSQLAFSYQLNTRVEGSSYVVYSLAKFTGSMHIILYSVVYDTNEIINEVFNRTAPGPSHNATMGHLNLIHENLHNGDEGLIYLRELISAKSQILQCNFVYLLGIKYKYIFWRLLT